MTCGIYCITEPNGKRYIGKSKNIEQRIRQHYNPGLPNFQFWKYEVLEECSEHELSDREWKWVYKLKPERNGMIPVLDSIRGRIWTNPNAARSRKKHV